MSTDETAGITARSCNEVHPVFSAHSCTKRAGHRGVHGIARTVGGGFEATWPQSSAEAGPLADIVVNPALVEGALQNATLPDRMRAAADTLDDVNARYDGRFADGSPLPAWDAANLRHVADRWEAEDSEQEERVQELARALYNAGWAKVTTNQARQLIADGWTKGETWPASTNC